MSLKSDLDKKSKLAQTVFDLSRLVKVNACKVAAAVHDGRKLSIDEKNKKKLDRLVTKNPQVLLFAGNKIMLAYQEYAESKILVSIVKDNKIPSLDVPAEVYLTGLGDAVGELKRKFLEELVSGNVKEAKRILKHAIKIHDMLGAYDYPDYIVPGLRRKKDQTRYQVNSMLEVLAGSHSANK